MNKQKRGMNELYFLNCKYICFIQREKLPKAQGSNKNRVAYCNKQYATHYHIISVTTV